MLLQGVFVPSHLSLLCQPLSQLLLIAEYRSSPVSDGVISTIEEQAVAIRGYGDRVHIICVSEHLAQHNELPQAVAIWCYMPPRRQDQKKLLKHVHRVLAPERTH